MKVYTGLLILCGLLSLFARGEQKSGEAVVGAGCFWCVEAVFEELDGVIEVVSGYAGGTTADPTYKEVSAGKTDHAEVVKIIYDPGKISYLELLDTFWKTHDPTDPRGVWPDFGPHYRSIILFDGPEQEKAARQAISEIGKQYDKPIATELAPLKKFYPAEEYHQDYVRNNPRDSYVRRIAVPKLKKVIGPDAVKDL
jgi:peptide-methionine (S)-S-oxide reductase